MPEYRIQVTSSDGSIDSDERECITLDGIGAARALAVETLLEASREKVGPGRSRAITVTVRDGRGAVVYGDTTTISGGPAPSSEANALHRAIGALNR